MLALILDRMHHGTAMIRSLVRSLSTYNNPLVPKAPSRRFTGHHLSEAGACTIGGIYTPLNRSFRFGRPGLGVEGLQSVGIVHLLWSGQLEHRASVCMAPHVSYSPFFQTLGRRQKSAQAGLPIHSTMADDQAEMAAAKMDSTGGQGI